MDYGLNELETLLIEASVALKIADTELEGRISHIPTDVLQTRLKAKAIALNKARAMEAESMMETAQ